MLAVLIVTGTFFTTIAALIFTIYKSALHMHHDWHYYEEGARRLQKMVEAEKDVIPDEVLQKLVEKGLASLSDVVTFILQTVAESLSIFAMSTLMTLLYMMFWLCDPIVIGEQVAIVFQQYILLKGLASFLYAMSIWLLLHFLGVDLSIVFGVFTFFFNFVPEIGPFFAMLLPLPVILFDGRLEHPIVILLAAFFGQLGLKFIFGNIVEVKLVESKQIMRMHPVMILFFVAFFGHIWGATGMLLSVPIMATLKATVSKIPRIYRDPFLILLEGDPFSPIRYDRYQSNAGERE